MDAFGPAFICGFSMVFFFMKFSQRRCMVTDEAKLDN